jgi:hypothetical protein
MHTGILRENLEQYEMNATEYTLFKSDTVSIVLPQFGPVFLVWFFISFFVIENAVIDITTLGMVTNIAPLHTFQINKKLLKYMQPILRYSKNNKWFF